MCIFDKKIIFNCMQAKLPRLFVTLDLDFDHPNLGNIFESIRSNPEVGVKVHSLLDEAFLTGKFDELKNLSSNLWYDSKLADIPSTIYKRVKALAPYFKYLTLKVDAVGTQGCQEAAKARDEIYKTIGKYVNLIGVTVLTSKNTDEYALQMGLNKDLVAKNLMQIAIQTGLDGIVCSGQEANMANYLRLQNNSNIKIITPGIKPVWAAANPAQSRITTPKEAIQNGADSLVVGTAIVKSENPSQAIQKILAEIDNLKYQTDIQSAGEILTPEQKIACFEPLDLFQAEGAVYYLNEEKRQNGKWCRLTSGMVSPFYINVGGVVDGNPKILNRIGQDIARKIHSLNLKPEATIGAMMGSVRLSSHTANFLNIKSIYLEKGASDKKAHETDFLLKRHSVQPGQKVVIVEDLITKGTTLKKLVKTLKEAGADILGIFLTLNRSGITNIDGIKVYSLQEMEPYAISEEELNKLYPKASISEKPKNEWKSLLKQLYF